MKIYRNGIAIHNLSIDEKTTIKRRLMVENSLNLSIAVSLESPLDLAIGDYTEVGSERYMIMDEPEYSLNKGVYDYTVLMRGNLHRLEVYMMPDEGRDEWSYSGSVVDHINMVVGVLNAKESGWSTSLPDLAQLADISPKSINYANMSILSALHTICSAENGWGLEFDVVGKKINFAKEIKNPTPRSFEYGKGKGLYELTRGKLSNERINTRVIGYGGKANQLKGLRLNFADINDGKNYIENNVDKYGLRETRVNFDHIFPRLKEAKIVSDATIVEAGKANWRVTTALDFDLTSFMSTEAVIMFQTGDCTGVEFQIVSYNHASKVLTFKENVDESGTEVYVMPNGNRHPKTGDGFVLLNILMPDSYTSAAKEELKQATRDEVARQSIPQRSYSVKCDPRYFKSEGSIPMPGDACRVIDKPHGVDYTSRIIEINYPVIYPSKIDMVLADKIPVPGGVVLSKSINNANTKVAALERSQLTEEHLSRIYHPFGGKLTEPLSASELRLATSAEVSGEDGYVAWVAEKLSGVGAEDPPASGGVGYWDELDGRPKYNALAPIPADANLDDRYSLANHNHNSAYASSNHRHEWSGIDQKPTTISGYGITDAYTMTQSDGRYAALNGSLTHSFAVASLKVAEGENGYIEWSAQPLTGVGATDPPSGGGGTGNYDELTNKPQLGGVELTGNKSLAQFGIQPTIPNETFAPYSHNHSHLGIVDERDGDIAPVDRPNKGMTSMILKFNESDGLHDGGSYHGSVIYHKWMDATAGSAFNLGFSDNGNLWMRHGWDSWSSWRRFYNTNDLSVSDSLFDANSATKPGFYRIQNTTTNVPRSLAGHTLMHLEWDVNAGAQMFFGYGEEKYYLRRKSSNIWSPWREIYHTGNFDPASKLGINPGGGISNASDSNINTTWFDYSWAGTGYAGSVINFSGLNGYYSTELFGCYGVSGNYFGLRTKNGDINTWNPVRWIFHSGNANLSYVDWTMKNANIYGVANVNVSNGGGLTITKSGINKRMIGLGSGSSSPSISASWLALYGEDGNIITAQIYPNGDSWINGNFGLGTTNPQAKLDVNGTAKAHTFIGNIYNAYGQVVGTGELIFKQY